MNRRINQVYRMAHFVLAVFCRVENNRLYKFDLASMHSGLHFTCWKPMIWIRTLLSQERDSSSLHLNTEINFLARRLTATLCWLRNKRKLKQRLTTTKCGEKQTRMKLKMLKLQRQSRKPILRSTIQTTLTNNRTQVMSLSLDWMQVFLPILRWFLEKPLTLK